MEKILLVGFGGHAKSLADSIEREGKYKIVGYTDISKQNSKYEYLGDDGVLQRAFDDGIKNVAVGIGYLGKGNVREKIYEKLKNIGYYLPVIKDPSAIIADSVVLGEGTFVGKDAIINAEAIIGKMAIINTKALIEHECIIGDFSHIAVSANLCGQVKVGRAAFVGANATITQGRKIESNIIVPAGMVIRRDSKNMKKHENLCVWGGITLNKFGICNFYQFSWRVA